MVVGEFFYYSILPIFQDLALLFCGSCRAHCRQRQLRASRPEKEFQFLKYRQYILVVLQRVIFITIKYKNSYLTKLNSL